MKSLIEKHFIGERVDSVQLTEDSKFWALASALASRKITFADKTLTNLLLAFDPGETTGVALYSPNTMTIYLGQIDTKNIGPGCSSILELLHTLNALSPVKHIRIEDYRVYGHMTETHSFSHLHTARVIGGLELICHILNIPQSQALAVHAKAFWDDKKLKMCGLYNPGLKHARDAQRHLLRFMCEADKYVS